MHQRTRKRPEHYYKSMYLDGYTPEEIIYLKHRDMIAERTDETPTVTVRTKVRTK